MEAALDLRRRTFKGEPPASNPASVPARVTAMWLTHAGARELLPAMARLCTYALDTSPSPDELAGAWYAIHGRRLLGHLALEGTRLPGAPDRPATTGLRSCQAQWATGRPSVTDHRSRRRRQRGASAIGGGRCDDACVIELRTARLL